ncbi:phage tail sheath subtilisin-like domain-containing protein [Bosea sp. TND4EK4]|uniref:phage tail sheath subtilisin-like domain-containing protein n=1 Tax=Bosea sp. TND4EK4 TaxID=1907408 RepID=UPI000955611B|nr:phage tail sheath subtilisin-like domain-containing protein [Bosea sp. TND4EK4]SIP96186.1 Mu-like prophage tail sheath protein gpL [Bosea sp. TND4EK4]
MINFNEIPYDWRVPGTYVEVRPNYQNMGLVAFPTRVVAFVQKLAAGIAVAGQLYEITRAEDATVLFGAGSIGQQMVAAFKKVNKTTRFYAIALADNGAGVKATKTMTFTGSGSGTIPIYIQNRRVRCAATAAMSVTQLATAAVAAINADADMPVVATSAAGVVTLTAKHAGECGNAIDVRLRKFAEEVLPGTIAVAIAAGTAGSGNPDVATLIAALANEWLTDLIMPWDDAANLAALTGELAARYQAMGRKDGHAYVGHAGTYGQLGTKGALTNSPYLSPIGAKNALSAPWEWASVIAGICAFQLTNDPARQLRGLELTGIAGPESVDCFTDTERDLLLRQGISTWNRLADGTIVIERVITAYKTTSLGAPDTAFLDIMVPKTATRIRYDWATYVTLLYPRHKLADDDSPAANNNDAVVTPRRMHGSWATRCKLYERQAWIEDVAETVAQSSFERDVSDKNRMNSRQIIRMIGNQMVLAAALEFLA